MLRVAAVRTAGCLAVGALVMIALPTVEVTAVELEIQPPIDIGPVGSNSYANAIEGDTVVGHAIVGETLRPFAYAIDTDTLVDLGVGPGTSAMALDVNAAGDILGKYEGDAENTFFVEDETGARLELGTFGLEWAEAQAMDDLGHIVGWGDLDSSVPGSPEGFVYDLDSGTTTMVAALGGAAPYSTSAELDEVSPLGLAAGRSTTDSGFHHAIIYDIASGEVTDIAALAGRSDNSGAAEATDTGLVLGNSDDGPFIYDLTTGIWSDLPGLGGSYTAATAINASGLVVGHAATPAGDSHAFLFDPETGVITDLGTLGGSSSYAFDISDDGVVTGWSVTTSGAQHAFIQFVTPRAPEPTTTTTTTVSSPTTTSAPAPTTTTTRPQVTAPPAAPVPIEPRFTG